MTKIQLEFSHGAQFASDNDRQRAIDAAKAVLDAFEWRKGDPMQIDYSEAQAAYNRHVSDEEYNRSPRDTIMIAAWERAQSAADSALTEGWHDPDGASCTIRAV
jgi:hypothetical protein